MHSHSETVDFLLAFIMISGSSYILQIDNYKQMSEINVVFNTVTASTDIWDGCSTTAVEPQNNTYTISKSAELAWISEEVSKGSDFSGKIIKLVSNLDLNNHAWNPIGSNENKFNGIFDGQAYRIANINVSGSGCTGIFGVLDINSKIMKLGILGKFHVSSENQDIYAGTVAGVNNGVIENCFATCEFSSDIKSQEKNNAAVGGIVGNNIRLVSNCFNNGIISLQECNINLGGISGVNHGVIKDCYNEGRVALDLSKKSCLDQIRTYCGGISGISHGFIADCYNEGKIESIVKNAGTDYIEIFTGGICGWNDSMVKDCYNSEEVRSAIDIQAVEDILISAAYAGGISGWNAGTIEKCYNEHDICVMSKLEPAVDIPEAFGGGISGANHGIIDNCYNVNRVNAEASIEKNAHVGI